MVVVQSGQKQKEKPNVEEGQIRETDSHKWLVGSISANRDVCGMLSEKGVIRYFPTDIVATWKIVTDETEEMFYNKVSNNLKEVNKNDECLYFTTNGWFD